MKKILSYIFLIVFASPLCADRDGFGGGFAGGLVGGTLGGVISSAGNRSSRRDVEALRHEQQQKEVDELRRKQDADRNELERKALEAKITESKTQGSSMLYMLWGLVILLLASIITLAFIVLRKK